MKNFEKYEKKLKEIINDDENIAYDKRTNEVKSCSEVLCEQCLFKHYFGDMNICASKVHQWLFQECEPESEMLLTDKERQYLCNIIEPFVANYNITIQKRTVEHYYAYCITIILKHKMFGSLSDKYYDAINLPSFNKNSHMYKGMDVSKIYKAEELELLKNPTKI